MRRRHITQEYGIEFEWRDRRWVLVLGEVAWWVGAILAGMGIAWILTALHGAGVTP
ncbi:MAG: hypothetical protein HY613_03780 [Candidatus Rokubacteria bacterium]|nr:hypothetical protein [Candidatus Rokubacteria bacterium]